MKKIILLLALSPAFAFAESPLLGRWKTIDDETGKPKSIVEIFQEGEVFKAKVVELINPEKKDPVCDKCPGDKKDKPMLGLEFMWGMKETKKDQQWENGEILDPNNGKIYRCRLRLKEKDKLEVRGFLGFSLLGRSQNWFRETDQNTADQMSDKAADTKTDKKTDKK